jgi:hypothetical protein
MPDAPQSGLVVAAGAASERAFANTVPVALLAPGIALVYSETRFAWK